MMSLFIVVTGIPLCPFTFSFPFCPSILEPGLYLLLCQRQLASYQDSFWNSQIFLFLESFLKLKHLFDSENGSGFPATVDAPLTAATGHTVSNEVGMCVHTGHNDGYTYWHGTLTSLTALLTSIVPGKGLAIKPLAVLLNGDTCSFGGVLLVHETGAGRREAVLSASVDCSPSFFSFVSRRIPSM